MSRLNLFRKWVSDGMAKILQTSQPKPAYKIYGEIMKKSAEEKNKKPDE
jgi:hypothetical protein